MATPFSTAFPSRFLTAFSAARLFKPGYRASLILSSILLAACGSDSGSDATAAGNGPGQAPGVAVAPGAGISIDVVATNDVAVVGGERIALTATISGDGAADGASASQVTWTLEDGSPGRLDTISGPTVNYIPPEAGTLSGNFIVRIVARLGGVSKNVNLALEGDEALPPPPAGAVVPTPPDPTVEPAEPPEGDGLAVLAGNDFGEGMRNGTGSAARFSGPVGVIRDDAGNLFVADTGNHAIRKIAPDNTVTTLAGMPGVRGSVDGTGSAARFDSPYDIAIDDSGNLYVTDEPNHTVRKITPAGVVTTLAGTAGVPGNADGTGAAAQFNNPVGIAANAVDELFVADMRNSLVRELTTGGTVTTYAGIRGQRSLNNGSTATATFIDPFALTVDVPGNVYVADGFFSPPEPNTIAGLSIIRKITPEGVVSSLAGGFIPETEGNPDGTGAAARFFQITDMTADSTGNLYVGDGRIRRVAPDGVVTTYLQRAVGQVNRAGGMTLDTAGNLYFSDIADHVVRSLAPGGTAVTLAGVATLSGSADGVGGAAQFNIPKGIDVDSAGNLYVADTFNHTIRRITSAGAVSTIAGSAGTQGDADGSAAAAQFSYPRDVVTDADGNVYVADTFNDKIRKITPAGVVSTLAGSGEAGSADGPGVSASFNSPQGITIDADGNLYVADTSNDTIRKITPDGVVSTLAGSPQQFGSADGAGAAARFNGPGDMTIDADGNLYVIDAGSTIRKITPAGEVSTLAGAAGVWGNENGLGAAARFRQPEGIALSDDGGLYVADTGNHAIRRVEPNGQVTTVAGNGAPGAFLQGELYRPARLVVTAPGILAITASNGVFRLTLP